MSSIQLQRATSNVSFASTSGIPVRMVGSNVVKAAQIKGFSRRQSMSTNAGKEKVSGIAVWKGRGGKDMKAGDGCKSILKPTTALKVWHPVVGRFWVRQGLEEVRRVVDWSGFVQTIHWGKDEVIEIPNLDQERESWMKDQLAKE